MTGTLVRRQSGTTEVVAAAVLWGTAGTAGAFAPNTAEPVSIAAARLVIGGGVLALAAGPAIRSALSTKRVRLPLLAGAAAVAAYQLCFFTAINRAGVAVGTVVAIGAGPIFAGLLVWIFNRERPTTRWAVATAAAIAGCVALVGGGSGDVGDQMAAGVGIALLGSLIYAFYVVMAARAIDAGVPSGAVMGVLFGGGGALMLPVLLMTGPAWVASGQGLIVALYLGCAATALAYILYGRGLRSVPVATAATLALAEPAVAALLGIAVLHERLSLTSWAGLGLLGVALLALTRWNR